MTDPGGARSAAGVPSAGGTLLEIGRVLKPRGLRGELRVQLHWAESDALSHAPRVWFRRAGMPDQSYELLSARPGNRCVFLQLGGIADVEAAEALRGAALMVDRRELPPLAPGEYYLIDLLGAVVAGPGGVVGEVIGLRSHPTVDAVLIRTPAGTELEQPLLDDFVAEVDAAGKRIVLHNLNGLVDSA